MSRIDWNVVDLDAPPARPHSQPRCESMPLFTERVNDAALTIVRVTAQGRTRHQLYAVTEDSWTLVAIFGNYTDALSELLRWRRYLEHGGTVAAWQLTHRDGIHPERRGFPR
jgi:hypothetical protein